MAAAPRVLIVSPHAGLDSEGALFRELARSGRLRLRVLSPRRAYCDEHQVFHDARVHRGPDYTATRGRIHGAKRNGGGPYLTGLFRELLLFRPDVIHLFAAPYTAVCMQAIVYRRWLRPSARCFGTAVSPLPLRAGPRGWSQAKRRFAQRRCDGVACWTQAARESLRASGFPERALAPTGYGVPLDGFDPGASPDVRRRLGLEGAFVVGYVGTLEIERGLWSVLLALRRLPAEVKCLCVGGGIWSEGAARKAAELGLAGRVVMTGPVPHAEVPSLLRAMDALVVPAETNLGRRPTYSLAIPEAMACGLPVVGSDAGVIPEIVGDGGLVFAERDFCALADGIRRLQSDAGLRAGLAEAGRRRARSLFSCESYAARLLAFYGMGEPAAEASR